MVMVLPTYSTIEEESSLIAVTQLIIAPEIIPGIIRGNVTFLKVLPGGEPRLIPASSSDGSICFRIEALERTE
jgi:hypothetical protein